MVEAGVEQHDRRHLLRDGADERQRSAEQRDPDSEPHMRQLGPARFCC